MCTPPYIFYEKDTLREIKQQQLFSWYICESFPLHQSEYTLEKIFVSCDLSQDFDITKAWIRKYIQRIESYDIQYDFLSYSEISPAELDRFYEIYKKFFTQKKIPYKPRDFFTFFLKTFTENVYLCHVRLWWKHVGSVISLRYAGSIIVFYGWYDIDAISLWLKYHINVSLIQYFSRLFPSYHLIFWSWVNQKDIDDPLLGFKRKFGDIYYIYKYEPCSYE